MKFYFYGKTPSKGYDVASGCLLIIGFAAIIYVFTLIDSLEDLEGNYFQLFGVLLMGGSLIFGLFQKKAKLHTHRIEIKDNFLILNKIKISLKDVHLNIYMKNELFSRYHLWDSKGIFSIFSVNDDDLLTYFSNHHPKNTENYTETYSKKDGAFVFVNSNERVLNYNLESGSFAIKEGEKTVAKKTPEFYIYDPKYRQGKPLLKKK